MSNLWRTAAGHSETPIIDESGGLSAFLEGLSSHGASGDIEVDGRSDLSLAASVPVTPNPIIRPIPGRRSRESYPVPDNSELSE